MYSSKISAMIQICMRNVLFLFFLLAASCFLTLPSFTPFSTSAETYSPQDIKTGRLDLLEADYNSGLFDEYSQDVRDRYLEKLRLLRQTQNGDIHDFFNALHDLRVMDLEDIQNGGYFNFPEIECKADIEFTGRMAALDNPILYEDSTKEPLLFRLADMSHTIPPHFSFIFPVVIAFCIFAYIEDDKLAFQMNLNDKQKASVCFITAVILCIACMILCTLPSSIIALVRNGIGDPNYPVVFIQGETIVSTTVLATVLKSFALWIAISIFMISIVALVFAISSHAAMGTILALAMGFIPYIPSYFDEKGLFYEFLRYLPTTYLDIASVAGWPNYAVLFEYLLPIPGASWGLGVAILLGFSFILCVMSLIAYQTKKRI